jgi:hypothetical protein
MLMCGRTFELYADTYHERIEWEWVPEADRECPSFNDPRLLTRAAW